jgi:hypothetical protein
MSNVKASFDIKIKLTHNHNVFFFCTISHSHPSLNVASKACVYSNCGMM